MDHWGDPWADNANDNSPTKNAVTSPLPPAFSFASVPLNGFVDDAGWGNNDDDGFGDWTTSPRVGTGNVALTRAESLPAEDQDPGSAGWGTVTHNERESVSDKPPETVTSTPQDFENVESEPSDSATVFQLDEAVSQGTHEQSSLQLQPDTEPSVRSSTSPSETSRNEIPIESPRTSIDDERGTRKDEVPQNQALVSDADSNTVAADVAPDIQAEEAVGEAKYSQDVEIANAHVADVDDVERSPSRLSDNSSKSNVGGESESTSDNTTIVDAIQLRSQSTVFVCDTALLANLFPSSEEPGKRLDTFDDPIHSTSARKAWYRLTRKQTMREFNHGDNDDNYIRVTWTNSHVRAEVNKVVGRWAREDRISGTGPGARASFYWDSPAPAEPKAPFGHLRTQSSIPATKTALPARQSLPPLATNKSAAFDWSSSASADSWKSESPTQSTSTPLSLKNPAVTKLQRQEGRAASVDLTPRKLEQTVHKRTATVSHTIPETTAAANLIPTPISQPSTEASESRASFNALDSLSTSTAEAADALVDDDDDWGEMVQTPTLPTPQQLDPFSHPSTTIGLPPPPLPKSRSPDSTTAQADSMEPMFASPIVRLQSTISPTSALFKANSFVPLHAEQGPIGPGILKPANRSLRSTPEKKLKINVPGTSTTEKIDVAVGAINDNNGGKNGGSSASIAPEHGLLPIEPKDAGDTVTQEKSSTSSTQPVTPLQASADSWTDADFSFFESALPATASQPSSQTYDPSDPLSFFDTRATLSTASTSTLSSRSPPREHTPPPLQPLNGTTSSAQRRKVEEDQTISDILRGLPDLSYMLR